MSCCAVSCRVGSCGAGSCFIMLCEDLTCAVSDRIGSCCVGSCCVGSCCAVLCEDLTRSLSCDSVIPGPHTLPGRLTAVDPEGCGMGQRWWDCYAEPSQAALKSSQLQASVQYRQCCRCSQCPQQPLQQERNGAKEASSTRSTQALCLALYYTIEAKADVGLASCVTLLLW